METEEIKRRLEEIETRLNILEAGKFNEAFNEEFNEEYADINGILLKRKNESLKYDCEHFTWDEAMRLFNDTGECRIPSKEEWEKMLEPGSTWDKEKKGIWIGKNHSLKQETAFSTFLPASGHRYHGNGFLYGQGSSGIYWSTGVRGADAYYSYFDSDGVNPAYSNVRVNGFSLRCIKKTKES
jgi:uncharacterized protein (TIGR02145 family)